MRTCILCADVCISGRKRFGRVDIEAVSAQSARFVGDIFTVGAPRFFHIPLEIRDRPLRTTSPERYLLTILLIGFFSDVFPISAGSLESWRK